MVLCFIHYSCLLMEETGFLGQQFFGGFSVRIQLVDMQYLWFIDLNASLLWINLRVLCCCVNLWGLLLHTELIDKEQCAGSEDAVRDRINKLMDEWTYLTRKSSEKGEKLQEANRQRMYTAAVKDLEFWLGEVCLTYQLMQISCALLFKQSWIFYWLMCVAL